MKVYGWTGYRRGVFPLPANKNPQTREIMAARSKAEVRREAGLERAIEIVETGDALEIETASASPGRVFWHPLNERSHFVQEGATWRPLQDFEHAADCGCQGCNDGGEDFTEPEPCPSDLRGDVARGTF